MTERLPQSAYTDTAWFTNELRTVFANAWIPAGTVHDFRAAGDYRTVLCGTAQIMVIRDKAGNLGAFHNFCRHRGAVLLDDREGNCGSVLVCPYHRWTYALDGALRGIPDRAECFPDLDLSAHGLKPAAFGVFRDIVFVNPDPNADFATWIEPLQDKAWPHDLAASDVSEAVPLYYDMKCDWKIYVENALDGYHLSYLHEKTIGGPPPGLNAWNIFGDHLVWYATEEGIRHRLPLKIRSKYGTAGAIRSAATPGYGGVYYLFPATLLLLTPWAFSWSTLHPVAPGRCRLVMRHWIGPGQTKDLRKYIQGYDKRTNTISSDGWTVHPLESGDFQTEDMWICEMIQKGMESPAYEHGPLARGAGGEDAIALFHGLMSRAMSLPGQQPQTD
ncbi:MAG: aromatic ring-hydroxylating dioxygenase subunit alpha [Pseudomonadota bacterium]